MKKTVVLMLSCLIGAALGFGIAALADGKSSGDVSFFGTFLNIAGLLIAVFLAVYIQIILHEAGHLVFGLLSGYRFVSFRIGSFTIVKDCTGKIRIKRFKLAGTGGQCLMVPPGNVAPEDVPTALYNAGGVLMNIFISTIALVLLITCKNSMVTWLVYLLGATAVMGFAIALINGLPMKVNGVANDGHNLLYLKRNKQSVKGFCAQLVVNEKIQNGTRPSMMPDELFDLGGEIDYSDSLQSNVEIMRISRILDSGDIEQAHNLFKELMHSHGHELLQLLRFELQCELLFTSIATSDVEISDKLLNDKQLIAYINAHAKVMTSKQRILMAKALLVDGNRAQAQQMLDGVVARRDSYLMQGEVESDIMLMRLLLDRENGGTEEPKNAN